MVQGKMKLMTSFRNRVRIKEEKRKKRMVFDFTQVIKYGKK